MQTFILNLIKYFIRNNLCINSNTLTIFEIIVHNKNTDDEIFLILL